jgi:hypothetical protein
MIFDFVLSSGDLNQILFKNYHRDLCETSLLTIPN